VARKICPVCKRLTGASSTTCSGCGHEFAATTVVSPVVRRVNRCPMCGISNEASRRQCQCGHVFETDPAALRDLLRSQRSVARTMLVGSIVLGVLGLAVPIAIVAFSRVVAVKFMIAVPFVALATAAAGARKATRILYSTRIGLDELDGRTDLLPTARVIEKK
jgi:hypothetical protein